MSTKTPSPEFIVSQLEALISANSAEKTCQRQLAYAANNCWQRQNLLYLYFWINCHFRSCMHCDAGYLPLFVSCSCLMFVQYNLKAAPYTKQVQMMLKRRRQFVMSRCRPCCIHVSSFMLGACIATVPAHSQSYFFMLLFIFQHFYKQVKVYL